MSIDAAEHGGGRRRASACLWERGRSGLAAVAWCINPHPAADRCAHARSREPGSVTPSPSADRRSARSRQQADDRRVCYRMRHRAGVAGQFLFDVDDVEAARGCVRRLLDVARDDRRLRRSAGAREGVSSGAVDRDDCGLWLWCADGDLATVRERDSQRWASAEGQHESSSRPPIHASRPL